VLIPVFNGANYLAEALETVTSQTYRPIDIIVVDDGSTDDSRSVAERFAGVVRYAYQPHSGIGAARNHGVELAWGDLLCFFDADDRMPPHRVRLQVEALIGQPDVDIVYGRVREFETPETGLAGTHRPPVLDSPLRSTNTMLIRKASFLRVGGFAENLTIAVELDWRARAIDHGLREIVLDQVVLERRLHEGNSSLQADSDVERFGVLKSAIDRRRAVAVDREALAEAVREQPKRPFA
jgi:glycosyltransferase involved in cell wall biosynthesis